MVWYIIGAVVLFLALLITVILMLPVTVLVLPDEKKGVLILGKILWLTFGEEPNPDSKITKLIKQILNIDKIESVHAVKHSVSTKGATVTVSQTVSILKDLVGRAVFLLKNATVKKCRLHYVGGGTDAAETAMQYGAACAVIYPLAGVIDNSMRVKKQAMDVNLSCDFDRTEPQFDFDIRLSVSVFQIVKALIRVIKNSVEKELYKEGAYGNRNSRSRGRKKQRG